jgi:hypothetical protein
MQPGSDHSGMPGMPGAPIMMDSGMEKLRTLVAELVNDPVVLREIQEDPALSRQWADDGVRRFILRHP